MNSDLDDCGEFPIATDISVRASIQQLLFECLPYGLDIALGAENSQ